MKQVAGQIHPGVPRGSKPHVILGSSLRWLQVPSPANCPDSDTFEAIILPRRSVLTIPINLRARSRPTHTCMTLLVVAIVWTMGSLSVLAQTGELDLTILDKKTRDPIPVRIRIEDGKGRAPLIRKIPRLGNDFTFRDLLTFKMKMGKYNFCLLYTSPSPRDQRGSRMPSSA